MSCKWNAEYEADRLFGKHHKKLSKTHEELNKCRFQEDMWVPKYYKLPKMINDENDLLWWKKSCVDDTGLRGQNNVEDAPFLPLSNDGFLIKTDATRTLKSKRYVQGDGFCEPPPHQPFGNVTKRH